MFVTLLLLLLTLTSLYLLWSWPTSSPSGQPQLVWKIVITVAFAILWLLYIAPVGQIHR